MDIDAQNIVSKLLKKHGLEGFSAPDIKDYASPIRVGRVLDAVNQNHQESKPGVIAWGDFALDFDESCFRHHEMSVILTEKEVCLLHVLLESRGHIVERATLLEKVWGYVDTVETHTLETHIYRLRQKIEDDPREPQIILTRDDGYMIL